MPEDCGRPFDESWLSGYADEALVQGDAQRVRVHLEDCAACRAVVDEIRATRQVTMSTTFEGPDDLQWSERPRSLASRISFGLGWGLIAVWLVVVAARAAYEFWRQPGPTVGELVAFAGLLGVALLFVGVLIDRIKASRTDRYKGVEK